MKKTSERVAAGAGTGAGNMRGALAFSAAGTYLQIGLQTVTTLIIARLITPADLALFSIGSALVALVQVLRDFGIASYVIREPNMSDGMLSTAFFVSVGLCWTLAAVLFAASGFAGEFYGQPGVTTVVRVLCLGIALVPFGAISLAVLQRRFAFGRVFVVNAVAATAHAVTAIELARRGYGALAMAWASVTGMAAGALATRLVAHRVFKLTLRLEHVRKLFTFGSRMTQIQIIRILQTRSPELILGKYLALADLGIFARANGVLDMFDRLVMQAVDPLIVPYLSDQARRSNALAEASVAATCLVASAAIPFFVFVAALAGPMVYVLFGARWMAAAPYVPILCLMEVIRIPTVFGNRLAVVADRLDLSRKVFIITAVTQMAALFVAARYGILVVCLSLVACACVHTISWGWASRKMTGIFGIARAIRAALVPATMVGISCAALHYLMDRLAVAPLVDLAVCAAAAAIVWLVALRVSYNPLYAEIRKTFDAARVWLGRRRVATHGVKE